MVYSLHARSHQNEQATNGSPKLYIYPIKSLRPAEVSEGTLTAQGLAFDRRFMLLKVEAGENGAEPALKNMHIPHFPEMGLFRTAIELPKTEDESGKLIVTYTPSSSREEGDTRPCETRRLEIPLRPLQARPKKEFKTFKVTMHQSATTGYDMGPEYNEWFSECFGFPVVLGYLGLNSRNVLGTLAPERRNKESWWRFEWNFWTGLLKRNPGWWPLLVALVLFNGIYRGLAMLQDGRDVPDEVIALTAVVVGVIVVGGHFALRHFRKSQITFADCAPFLVVSETSIDDVSARLPEGEEMDRTKFRPNIVVSGAETAYEEDFWTELVVGPAKARLLLTGNCVRCKSLNVDYETGKAGTGEAGAVLKKLMKDRRVDRGAKFSPVFGRYSFLEPAGVGETIRVGDKVQIVAQGKERTVTGECLMGRIVVFPGIFVANLS